MSEDINSKAGAAVEWLDLGLSYMKEARFGEAVNALRNAAESTDAPEEVRNKAMAAIEVISDINGFVNTDLMNPKNAPCSVLNFHYLCA
ncbi:MAG: hypothetical protein K2G18_07300 [Bacteroidales bacterium]|nr:hypothetical protein [Bacteroidales bacterium]